MIPVIDLLDDQAVHAVKGRRDHYRPVQSVLCDTPNPMALARAFSDRLRLHEIYIADLNAIQGFGRTGHRNLIACLSRIPGSSIMLDAGVSDTDDARDWIELGVGKVVIASETLDAPSTLEDLPAAIDGDRIIFSLDLRGQKILSKCSEFAALKPIRALAELARAGWQEVILLDLERVGSGVGTDTDLIAEANKELPGLRLLIGGGVRGIEDLKGLKSAGAAGVLIATALHQGLIDARQIEGLML